MTQTTLRNNQPVRLITIPVSHYCEKIRWALTRLQIPFVEERHMPPFHLLATQPVGGRSVPVLITAANTFTDSADILKYLDSIAPDNLKLYPHNPEERRQVEELVESFDAVLAPAVRQWFYFYAFSQAQLIKPLWCEGVPWYEQLLFPVVFQWMRSTVFEMYTINAESAEASYQSICQIFETVEKLLADGRTYLVGERFSAADLTFATLAAGVVLPNNYGVSTPALSKLPSPMAVNIQAFRETRAGLFVLNLYQEHEQIAQQPLI
jgi:glutathione S-transferase